MDTARLLQMEYLKLVRYTNHYIPSIVIVPEGKYENWYNSFERENIS
jgi:hypothetical protein